MWSYSADLAIVRTLGIILHVKRTRARLFSCNSEISSNCVAKPVTRKKGPAAILIVYTVWDLTLQRFRNLSMHMINKCHDLTWHTEDSKEVYRTINGLPIFKSCGYDVEHFFLMLVLMRNIFRFYILIRTTEHEFVSHSERWYPRLGQSPKSH